MGAPSPGRSSGVASTASRRACVSRRPHARARRWTIVTGVRYRDARPVAVDAPLGGSVRAGGCIDGSRCSRSVGDSVSSRMNRRPTRHTSARWYRRRRAVEGLVDRTSEVGPPLCRRGFVWIRPPARRHARPFRREIQHPATDRYRHSRPSKRLFRDVTISSVPAVCPGVRRGGCGGAVLESKPSFGDPETVRKRQSETLCTDITNAESTTMPRRDARTPPSRNRKQDKTQQ